MTKWEYLPRSAKREIIRDTIALFAIVTIGTAAIASACIKQARAHRPGNADRWTDTQLCIDSYDGLIDYDTAVDGCKSRRLQGLSYEQQADIWNLPADQREAIAVSIQDQATAN